MTFEEWWFLDQEGRVDAYRAADEEQRARWREEGLQSHVESGLLMGIAAADFRDAVLKMAEEIARALLPLVPPLRKMRLHMDARFAYARHYQTSTPPSWSTVIERDGQMRAFMLAPPINNNRLLPHPMVRGQYRMTQLFHPGAIDVFGEENLQQEMLERAEEAARHDGRMLLRETARFDRSFLVAENRIALELVVDSIPDQSGPILETRPQTT